MHVVAPLERKDRELQSKERRDETITLGERARRKLGERMESFGERKEKV